MVAEHIPYISTKLGHCFCNLLQCLTTVLSFITKNAVSEYPSIHFLQLIWSPGDEMPRPPSLPSHLLDTSNGHLGILWPIKRCNLFNRLLSMWRTSSCTLSHFQMTNLVTLSASQGEGRKLISSACICNLFQPSPTTYDNQ